MKIPSILLALALFLPAQAAPCCENQEKPAAASAAGSLHELDSSWTDQNGEAFQLSKLKNRVVLMTMGYTTCKFACPRLVADLLAIEKKLTPEEKDKVDIVFVSIDPLRDTPPALKGFLEGNHADANRWRALGGDDDGILELSVALGIRYRKVGDSDFAHSNIIALLSPAGEVVHRQEGLGADPAALLGALRKLLATDEP
ncbi:MAG: SCO family protein [Akkermansiaceae bacterium]|jgi:protein SCO1/2|nr:SCO family protein [Akkermansiaceae bacterium]